MKGPLFLIRRPVLAGKKAYQAFRLALGLYVENVEAELFLVGDGVYTALPGLDPACAGGADPELFRQELAELDILPAVLEEDLAERGLRPEDLRPGFRILQREDLRQSLAQARTILAF